MTVAPSILAADFGRLADQVAVVLGAGARWIHVDVMDGHFVPPITMGPNVVAALADQIHEAGAEIDVHLMIERPERQVEAFAAAGADGITFHAEATPHVHRVLQLVREAGRRPGLALCPGTPVEAVRDVVDELTVCLCMTVNPGWGGQPFIPHSLDKVRRLRGLLGPGAFIEVDGGIDRQTIGPCAAAGATHFVAGTSVFGADDPAEAFAVLSEHIRR